VKYRFRAAKSFRRALARLPPEEKRLAATAFKIFKQNPFDPRLRGYEMGSVLFSCIVSREYERAGEEKGEV
jgi:hypothetical protein